MSALKKDTGTDIDSFEEARKLLRQKQADQNSKAVEYAFKPCSLEGYKLDAAGLKEMAEEAKAESERIKDFIKAQETNK